MKKLIVITILIFLVPTDFAYGSKIVRARHHQADNQILFEYDLIGEGKEDNVEVNISITINGKTYKGENLHLEGDFGVVRPGEGKKIHWHMSRDFPNGLDAAFTFNIEVTKNEFTDPITGMKFIFVKGGCYLMGDIFDDGESDEKPAHEVCVDDFWMGKFEVTQDQWKTIMSTNPSYFIDCGYACPVEKISWHDAQEFIRKLNKRTPSNYRLPTEAEWEYAARSGGRREKYAGTDNESELENYAWCANNAGNSIHPVGQKKPNGLGLYDMSGNVWEWVQDCYGIDYYKKSSRHNPQGPDNGKYRILRGGSWYGDQSYSRVISRFRYEPSSKFIYFGFRLAFSSGKLVSEL